MRAKLVTLCGCSRWTDVWDPPPPTWKVPLPEKSGPILASDVDVRYQFQNRDKGVRVFVMDLRAGLFDEHGKMVEATYRERAWPEGRSEHVEAD